MNSDSQQSFAQASAPISYQSLAANPTETPVTRRTVRSDNGYHIHKSRVELAASYVDDAFHGRDALKDDKTQRVPKLQRLVHKLRHIRKLLMLLFMLIPLFEPPSWCFTGGCTVQTIDAEGVIYTENLVLSNLNNGWLSMYQSLSIELTCLLLFLAVTVLRVISVGVVGFFTVKWRIARTVFILAAIVDTIVTLVQPYSGFRIVFVLRPLIFLSSYQSLRVLLQSLMAIVPKIMDIMFLTAAMVIFYASFALFLFRDFADLERYVGLYFGNLGESFVTFTLLLTTGNVPAILAEPFTENYWTFLFFVPFVLLGCYFVLSLLLATVFQHFAVKIRLHQKDLSTHRGIALDNAFEVLADQRQFVTSDDVRQLFYELQYYQHASFLPEPAASAGGVDDVDVIIRVLVKRTNREGDSIAREEFRALCTLVQEQLEIQQQRARTSGADDGFLNTCIEGAETFRSLRGPLLRNIYEWTMVFVNILNVVLLLLALELWHGFDSAADDDATWERVEFCFTMFFVFEMIIKVLTLGTKGFWVDKRNVFDLIVNLAAFCSESYLLIIDDTTVLSTVIRYVLLGRMLRVFRVLSEIPRFHVFFATFWHAIVPMARLGGVLVFVLYLFGALGVHLLGGYMYQNIPVLEDSVYASNGYWCYQFNDMGRAVATLFVMMIKDWVVILNAYESVVGDRAEMGLPTATVSATRVLFICFYIVSVFLVINIMIAYILDIYNTQLHKRGAEHTPIDRHPYGYHPTHNNVSPEAKYGGSYDDDHVYVRDATGEVSRQVKAIISSSSDSEGSGSDTGHRTPVRQQQQQQQQHRPIELQERKLSQESTRVSRSTSAYYFRRGNTGTATTRSRENSMNTDNDEDVSSQNRSNLLDDVNLEESDDDDNLFT